MASAIDLAIRLSLYLIFLSSISIVSRIFARLLEISTLSFATLMPVEWALELKRVPNKRFIAMTGTVVIIIQ